MAIHLFKRLLNKCGQTVTVKERALGESSFDDQGPDIGFTNIGAPAAMVKTIESVRGGSKLFSGIQIDPDATHLFCILYDVTYSAVERDNFYIELSGKYYRVLAVTNIDERNSILAIQTSERGYNINDAVKA